MCSAPDTLRIRRSHETASDSAGGIERAGPRLVGDSIALLDDVEGGPEIVGGDVGGDRAPRLGPDGGELADEADRRTEAVLALLEPGLEPPVQALASSAVVLQLLAGDRTDRGVGEVLHQRRPARRAPGGCWHR